MTGPYGAAALPLYAKGWSGVLSLPAGEKSPPPTGSTGWDGKDATMAEVLHFTQNGAAGGNIGIRLPGNVLGIDVDDYVKNGTKKHGGRTLAECCARWGDLPPTWSITSRGVGASRISLYRTPVGLHWPTGLPGGDVELIHYGHRYAVGPGSIHPESRQEYVLYDPAGRPGPVAGLPRPEALPELPERWVQGLQAQQGPGSHPRTNQLRGDLNGHHQQWLDALPGADGEPCRVMREALDRARGESSGSRYDGMVKHVLDVVRTGEIGHAGVNAALVELGAWYVDAVDGDRPGDVVAAEFDRALKGACQKIAGDPTTAVAGGDPCGWSGSPAPGEDRAATGEPGRPVTDLGAPDSDAEHLDGARLLGDVRTFLARFVSYPNTAALIAHVLWIAHVHLMSCWESTPRIAFLSPEPGSGKSRCLEVTEPLVPRPVHAVNTTPAYLFRKVSDEAGTPTILYDEIDTVFGPRAKDNEDIRGMLNAGHRRGAVAGRCVVRGKIVETEELPAYCAVAMAGLNDLPDTLMSRAVVVRMRRRAPGEQVEPWRLRVNGPQAEPLRQRLETWSGQVRSTITKVWPAMPEGIEDRNADIWEALLAVADAAGGEWPKLARVTAVTVVTDSMAGVPSLGVQLLADLRTIFVTAAYENLETKIIIERLVGLEESPWADIHGRELNARSLSQRLRGYGIKPGTHRSGDRVFKGYSPADLADAWARYLPPLATEDPVGPPVHGTVTSVTPVTPPDPGPSCRVCGRPLLHPASRAAGICAATDLDHEIGRSGGPPPTTAPPAPPPPRRVTLCEDCGRVAIPDTGLCERCMGLG